MIAINRQDMLGVAARQRKRNVAIRIENISKWYGDFQVLTDVYLKVAMARGSL
ncbi:hypothetical protein [Mesorhizobium sp. M1A.F.Ca.ET.072.01.1.1]|uniref:hypothetical protein n=1 Tax=Mesorhizobium sp. M1A.F.Ca.ET.072.01.1.1 TaxID=2496753 RepID=UPI00167B4C45|nr:hypothetical protein [Mesorhizobium sp. M1A.F.Ca.ET.072.01.1.1]